MSLIKVPIPWKGMDTTSEPDSLTSGQGTLVHNLLPGRTGQLVPRGPLGVTSVVPNTAFDDAFHGGGGFWISPSGSTYLQQVGAASNVSAGGGAPFAIPGGGVYIGPSYAQMDTYTVGITGSISTTPALYTWDGVTTMVKLTNGPINIVAVASHLDRVFALSATTLFWTDSKPNLPGNTAAMWQDDVTGLTNQIPLPSGEVYREVVEYNRVLYIIGDHSVYALLGDTPTTFALRKVLELGIADGTGYSNSGHAEASNRGLYFWSYNGLVRFDGVNATVVSRDVQSILAVGASQWHRITAIHDEYISVITQGRWLLYHEPTGAWSSLSSTTFHESAVHLGVSGLPTFVRPTQTPGLGASWTAFSAGANSTSTLGVRAGVQFNPDYAHVTGNWLDGFTDSINAQAISACIRLTSADRGAAIRRLHAEAGAGGWSVQVEDEAGVSIGQPAVVVAGPMRARAESSLFGENDIVRVRWTWDGQGADRLSSIGDAYIEADTAQQR